MFSRPAELDASLADLLKGVDGHPVLADDAARGLVADQQLYKKPGLNWWYNATGFEGHGSASDRLC